MQNINLHCLIALIISLLFCNETKAQNFHSAIGIHLGNPNGLTYKHFINKKNAIEVLSGITATLEGKVTGVDATVLYEWNKSIFDRQLNVFYGLGGQGGVYSKKISLGADSIIGIEYTLDAPFVFGFNGRLGAGVLIGDFRLIWGGGIFARYVIQ